MRASTGTLAIALLAAAPAAYAQTTPDGAATPSAPGDIVVTANRDKSLASKTPIALTALSGNALISAGVTNPATLGEQVPGLSIDRANGGIQITIRGVSSGDSTEKGDPSAAFLQDGIYIARQQAQEVSFFDIARVEVLRGPQGTLYGRNTTAGVIGVISNAPKHKFEASANGTIGNFGTRQATAMVNVPVGEHFALRGAVNYDRRDSYLIAGATTTAKLSPFKDNISGRLSALVDWAGGSFVLRGDYSHMGGQTANTVAASNFYTNLNVTGVDPTYRTGLSNSQQRTITPPITSDLSRHNSTWGLSGDLNQELGPVSLAYLGSYREFTRNENQPLFTTDASKAYLLNYQGKYWQNSQELRFSTNGNGPLKLQVGGYYFKEHSNVNQYVFGLISATPGTTGYVYAFNRAPNNSESLAGFGQATYKILPTLRLTAGLRYSHDTKNRIGYLGRCATTACDLATDIKAPNVADLGSGKLTWRVGADADIGSRTMVYGTVSTGYKSGGFNDGCLAGTAGCTSPLPAAALYYKPETLTSYEIGFKTHTADNTLRLNASAFHYDYNNLQLSQTTTICGAPCNVTTNAAKAIVNGVELESVLTPTPRNRVEMTVSWLDAHYRDFMPSTTVSFAGKQLDHSPRWSVLAGYTYTLPLRGGSNLEAAAHSHLSAAYYLAGLSASNQFRQPAYTKTDLTLTYNAPDRRWFVQGFVNNIENALVISTAVSGSYSSLQISEPRMYGARGGVKF